MMMAEWSRWWNGHMFCDKNVLRLYKHLLPRTYRHAEGNENNNNSDDVTKVLIILSIRFGWTVFFLLLFRPNSTSVELVRVKSNFLITVTELVIFLHFSGIFHNWLSTMTSNWRRSGFFFWFQSICEPFALNRFYIWKENNSKSIEQ